MKKHGMIAVRIFLSFVLAVAPFTALAQSGSKGAAGPVSRAAGHSDKSVPDVSPDTVLVRFPVENGQPLEFTLKQLMDAYKIPGLSIAVIDNYQIAWSKAFGVTEWGGSAPVTPRTLFQAGSISKPVAATGALWLVEQGKLSLDEDVNKKLRSWQVPENEFTRHRKSRCAGS